MNSARELSIMVLDNSPESGRILSMRMSRFSGYNSGASTTGQRSWGKSGTQHKNEIKCLHLYKRHHVHYFYSDWQSNACLIVNIYMLQNLPQMVKTSLYWSPIPRQSVLRKASICSCPTPLAPFWPNSRWESSRCKTSMAMSWKPPSWLPPRSASTYDRRRSGSFCLINCAAEKRENQVRARNVRQKYCQFDFVQFYFHNMQCFWLVERKLDITVWGFIYSWSSFMATSQSMFT